MLLLDEKRCSKFEGKNLSEKSEMLFHKIDPQLEIINAYTCFLVKSFRTIHTKEKSGLLIHFDS
jgi:hypothetical protein